MKECFSGSRYCVGPLAVHIYTRTYLSLFFVFGHDETRLPAGLMIDWPRLGLGNPLGYLGH